MELILRLHGSPAPRLGHTNRLRVTGSDQEVTGSGHTTPLPQLCLGFPAFSPHVTLPVPQARAQCGAGRPGGRGWRPARA